MNNLAAHTCSINDRGTQAEDNTLNKLPLQVNRKKNLIKIKRQRQMLF